jgi:Phage protein (N4 Gp49/phage Sf6 gene 66) family
MNLQEGDAAAAAVAKGPRVSLADINAHIAAEYDFVAAEAVGAGIPVVPPLKLLTICILVLHNGYTVVGKSACAAPENFNRQLGRQLARDDAVRQIWPLMGYALREKLASAGMGSCG